MVKVMIVDDHEDIVISLKKIVEKLGYESAQANSGEELLEKLDEEKPDIILLDVMMPGITLKQTLSSIKEKKIKKLKIILVTVVRFAEKEKKELMKASNVVDYIPKPFSIFDIMEKLKLHAKK